MNEAERNIIKSLFKEDSETEFPLQVLKESLLKINKEPENLLKSLIRKEVLSQRAVELSTYSLTDKGVEVLTKGSLEFRIAGLLDPSSTYSQADIIRLIKDNFEGMPGKTISFLIFSAVKAGYLTEQDKIFTRSSENISAPTDNLTKPLESALSTLRTLEGSQKSKLEISTSEAITVSAAEIPHELAWDLKALVKNKWLKLTSSKQFYYSRGDNFANILEELTPEVTPAYFTTSPAPKLKPLKLGTKGKPTNGGSLHPVASLRNEFRQIFLEMGFREMRTDSYVERAFWNFDALFIPQKHPARDLQDTFYLSGNPFQKKEKSDVCGGSTDSTGISLDFSDKDLELVAAEHERAFSSNPQKEAGSEIGSSPEGKENPSGECLTSAVFSKEETDRYCLRTHTTAVTSRMLRLLSSLSKQSGNLDANSLGLTSMDRGYEAKLFSIDRVFRNETLDATHLAEFHQIEGLVAGPKVGLADLLGFLEYFFTRIGIKRLRFKAAFNPYTEPSVEVFGYSEELGKFIEIGNSGMFRREVLDPAGVPQDVNVVAWGLSLERPAMMMQKCQDIREMCGEGVRLILNKGSPWAIF